MRLDVAIIGSGTGAMAYPSETRFMEDFTKLSTFIGSEEPFKTYEKVVWFHPVWTLRDLAFKRSPTMNRLLTANMTDAKLACDDHAIPVERGLILANTGTYGGSGGIPFGVSYNGTKMLRTALHEFGHTLANLHDEYQLYSSQGSVADALSRQLWRGTTEPKHLGGVWVKGACYPNWWRQKAGPTPSASIMRTLDSKYFGPIAMQLLIEAIQYWDSRP